MNMMTITALTMPGVASSGADKTVSLMVWFWVPKLLVILHVYSKLIVSVFASVNSSKSLVPFASTVPFASVHSMVLTARSVVQFRETDVPCG